jgi:hypothetical protein
MSARSRIRRNLADPKVGCAIYTRGQEERLQALEARTVARPAGKIALVEDLLLDGDALECERHPSVGEVGTDGEKVEPAGE